MVSNKQRNWITQARTKGTANPNSANQHQLLLVKIRVRIKKEQEQQKQHIQFDIDTLRDNPSTLKGEMGKQSNESLVQDKAILADARRNKDPNYIIQRNTKEWPIVAQKLYQIQEKSFR